MNRRRICLSSALVAGGLMLAACAPQHSETTKTETVTVSATPTSATAQNVVDPLVPTPITQIPSAPTTTEAVAATPALMPAVVCANLQDAQNAIQAAGVFYSRSADATGKGRHQILDSNWVVVAQKPAPGDPVTEGQAVLSVVKIGEPGDCS